MSSVASATSPAGPSYLLGSEAAAPGADAMAEFLAAIQALSQSQLDFSATRIHDKRDDLDQALEDFLKKLADACKKAQERDDAGFFGDVFGALGDVCGDLLGTIADFTVDAVTLPFEAGVSVVKNFGDTAAMLDALQANTAALVQNGAVASDVHGFTEGVVRFGAELAEWTVSHGVDCLEAMLAGKNPADVSDRDLAKLWGNFKANILDNPGFWAVTAAAAKAGALAASAMSGGALLPVAIGLLVALEVDKRTGIIEKAVGAEAAPWVRLGLGVAASLCMLGGHGGAIASTLRSWCGIASGVNTLHDAYTTVRNANEQADQLEQQAELTAALDRARALQRTISTLVEQLGSDSKDKTQTQKLGASLMQTEVAANAAAIIPA